MKQEQNTASELASSSEYVAAIFRELGTEQAYKKNTYIFHEHDEPNAAYYVDQGLIKISQSPQDGQDITLFLRQAGEAFGNAEVLSKVPRQRYAKCLTDSLLISLDSLKYMELMKQDAEFSYAVAVMGARRLLQTQLVVETLICRPAAWRLAWFLIQLGQCNGEQLDIVVQLSHEEISYVVGCSRQTVTEILNRWREQGLITYTKKKIVILQPESFLSDI